MRSPGSTPPRTPTSTAGCTTSSERATVAYDEAREKVARFLNARSADEIIFTRGTTEGINLVAQTYGRTNLKPGDDIVITAMEHHSNIVPWQLLCEQTGATLRAAPFNDAGELDLDAFERLLSDRTRLVAVVHVSNALGTINPISGAGCTGPRSGHPGAGRRRPGGPAPPGGRPGTWIAISLSSPATRSSGPRGSACSMAGASPAGAHAALPRRW